MVMTPPYLKTTWTQPECGLPPISSHTSLAWSRRLNIFQFVFKFPFWASDFDWLCQSFSHNISSELIDWFKDTSDGMLYFLKRWHFYIILYWGRRKGHFCWSWELATAVNFGQHLRWPILRALRKLATLFSHQLFTACLRFYPFWFLRALDKTVTLFSHQLS